MPLRASIIEIVNRAHSPVRVMLREHGRSLAQMNRYCSGAVASLFLHGKPATHEKIEDALNLRDREFQLSAERVASLALPAAFAGGEASGGGNGYQGVPLESYAVDLVSLPEFKEIVSPMLYRLQQKLPGLKEDLTRVYESKNIYLIPALLEHIPSYVVGVTFKTDQLALQTQGSIWIDSVYYDRMRPREKATLLVHELVMGLVLARDGISWECSRPMRGQMCDAVEIRREDYESVRRVTRILLEELDRFSADRLKTEIGRILSLTYETADESKPIGEPLTIEELYLALGSEHSQHGLPYKSRDGSGCAYEFSFQESTKTLSILIYPSKNGMPRKDLLPFAVQIVDPLGFARTENEITYSWSDPIRGDKSGSLRKYLEITMNRYSVVRISAFWQVYQYNYRTKSMEWVPSSKAPRNSLAPVSKLCINE